VNPIIAEKRPLSYHYQTPQSVHSLASSVWCSDIAIENALWGQKIGENRGSNGRILTRNELDLIWFETMMQSFIKIDGEL